MDRSSNTQDGPLQSPKSILVLPTELLEAIGSFLDRTDLLTLRCTNRRLDLALAASFGKHIATIKVIIHSVSLEKLQQLSHRTHLAKYVEHLIVGTESVDQYTGNGAVFKPYPEVMQRSLDQLYVDGKVAAGPRSMAELQPGREMDTETLYDCIQRFPRLKCLRIEDMPRTEHFPSIESFLFPREKYKRFGGYDELAEALRVYDPYWNGPYRGTRGAGIMPYAGRRHACAVFSSTLARLDADGRQVDVHVSLRSRNYYKNNHEIPIFVGATNLNPHAFKNRLNSLYLDADTMTDWMAQFLEEVEGGTLETLTLSGFFRTSPFYQHKFPYLSCLRLQHGIMEHHNEVLDDTLSSFSSLYPRLTSVHIESFAVREYDWAVILSSLSNTETLEELVLREIYLLRDVFILRPAPVVEILDGVEWHGRAMIKKGSAAALQDIGANEFLDHRHSRGIRYYYLLDLTNADVHARTEESAPN
ncbi:hypothetical protein BDV96DRAFT_642927 [Lophiotrema nucula]|uniref:F-box domain-containing protein n=1 Tax=Lophiotrema nucula TaxID=690887 RepID=A0A6A5ZKH6_9PLEO|nr:hypothetical protein BDV96DRAFT_642927 [Lophiotrema nucula]